MAQRRGRLRFGVCGTGHWANLVHLPALAAMPEVDLVGVCGRTAANVETLASKFGIRAFTDYRAMLEAVDAVSFVVPPDIQARLALEALKADRHLVLEKPIATSLEEADGLVAEARTRGVSSTVFFTRLFSEQAEDLIARARAARPTSATARFSSKALLAGSPYAESAWRLTRFGALWDLGPHVLSILVSVLGPVVEIRASSLAEARFECEMRHTDGATSTMVLDHRDESIETSNLERYAFSGAGETVEGGSFKYERTVCLQRAVARLLAGIDGGTPIEPSLRFGRDVVAVLDAARDSIESGADTFHHVIR